MSTRNPKHNANEIGLRIASLRKSKHLSQERLSEMLGIGSGHLSKVERGKEFLSLRLLIKLSELFEISLDELIYGFRAPDSKVSDANDSGTSTLYTFSSDIPSERKQLDLLLASCSASEYAFAKEYLLNLIKYMRTQKIEA